MLFSSPTVVFAPNNPTLYAIADAALNLKQPYDSLRVVSLGVGSYPEPKSWRSLFKFLPSVSLIQKILGTNTCSMETLRSILFDNVKTVRISETFNEPEMATDLLETNLKKLNRLVQKGRDSFGKMNKPLENYY